MKIFNIIFSVLLCGLYGFLSYITSDLGLLSNKILLSLSIAGWITIILIIVGLFKLKSKIFKGLLYFISLIIMIISFFGSYYIKTTISFIDDFGNKNDEFNYYYVITKKDSNYNKIDELKNKSIGLSSEITDEVINKIKIDYKGRRYDDLTVLVNDLYKNKIDAILISDVNEYLIETQDELFTKRVKVIDTIKIPKKEEITESNKKITDEPFVVFISGIDTGGKISRVSRSDVNIVATINPVNNEVLLTTIPRDFYVQLHGTNGTKDKLTHAGIYGINKSITTIEDLLGVNIDYYVRVNFDTVVKLVDQIGGITIYSDQNLNFCDIKQGNNNLDGACALRFARERYSYKTGDRHRGENQEEVIKAIIRKIETTPTLLTKYSSIMENLSNNFETNVTNDVIKSFIKLQMKQMPSWKVKTYNLNGFDSHNYTYSGGRRMLYVMEPDYKTVDRAKELINGMLSGKKFNELGL